MSSKGTARAFAVFGNFSQKIGSRPSRILAGVLVLAGSLSLYYGVSTLSSSLITFFAATDKQLLTLFVDLFIPAFIFLLSVIFFAIASLIDRGIYQLVVEFKSLIIVSIAYVFVGEMADFTVFDLLEALVDFILYLIQLALYHIPFFETSLIPFNETSIDPVFILLVPLVLLFGMGFLVLIFTED
ncbi:MAG: hypothetical protein ACFFD4_21290 [Candidatus Odinarchaeota archaeon]